MNIIYKIIFFNLLMVCLSFTSCSNTSESEQIDYHNKILFTSKRSGKEQLYMMNPDGTNIKQITSGKYWHNNGRWSPDAQKIVCNTEERTTTAGTEMVVFNSDGSNRMFLGWGNQMTWHPDGDIILFSMLPSLEIGLYGIYLYTINLHNNQIIKLSLTGEGGSPDFSPYGNQIIYMEPNYNSNPPKAKIKIISYPECNNEILIDSTANNPIWSPDGTKITFSKREILSEPNDDIYIGNIDGTNYINITHNKSNMPYIYPNWSPDGEKIIFLAYTVDDKEKWYLYMINKDGTNLHRVIEDATITSCDWSK